MRMTLDELINAMEPQARKDKALISKCVDGLTEYAAELRQKAGDAGKEQISALRRLVDELAGYWGLDAKTVDHVTAFDRKIQEVDQAVHQWTPTQEHRDAVIQGLYLYAIDMISSLGSDGARESVTECERLMREIAGCALPGFVDSKNEEKTERNAGYLVVSHSGGGMLRQGTRKGIRRTPANRGMRAHWVVKGLDISEDVCHGMCP